MRDDDAEYLKTFYQALMDRPLDPATDGALYVPLYQDRAISPSDPVSELQTTIEWSGAESAQLFSGFRGTGKSTELRRLRQQLRDAGCAVVLCDMQQYLNLTTPIDVSDFMLAMAGAFGDALKDEALLGKSAVDEGYWDRFVRFAQSTRVEVGDLGLGLGADVRLNLKSDPTFRQKLQKAMSGHLGALVQDVHAYFAKCVHMMRERSSDDGLRVVLLLDSVEQIRGTSANADDVASSLETLFFSHAEKLRVPHVHVVYTVPPWLKIKAPGVAGLYSSAQLVPCVKVHEKDGRPCEAGLNELEQVIRLRCDPTRAFGQDRQALRELLLASGGYLRDLFRLVQTTLRLARREALPVSAATRKLAIDEVRNSYLPIALNDAAWLARVQRARDVRLEGQERLADLSRFFDTHLVLTYRNGDEWVAVHPLLRDEVERLAGARGEGVAPAAT